MTDFMSMMGYREYTISKIISDARGCWDLDQVKEVCSSYGLPWNDLLYDEKERIRNELNL